MSAIRGRRPLVGVLTGGSGGTYIAPTLRNARGRAFPGVLVSFGGSSRANSIRQILPALTQAATGGPVLVSATVTQHLAALRQALAGTAATTTARSVRVTYLALEVPDPAITAAIAQQLAALTQAADGSTSPDDRVGAISQTLAALTQVGVVTVGPVTTARGAQVLPALTQALTGDYVEPVPVPYGVATELWRTAPRARIWRTRR